MKLDQDKENQLNNFTYNLNNYGIRYDLIEAGNYGSVYQYRKEGKKYAVKEVKNNALGDFNYTTLREITYLKILSSHPHINTLIDCCFIDQTYIVLDLTEIVNIRKFFDKSSDKDRRQIILDVTHGLIACRENGILHRDIKPENILIKFEEPLGQYHNPKNSFKRRPRGILADFGIAKGHVLNDDKKVHTGDMYSLWYRPPEVLLGENYGFPGEVWAWACTIYSLMTGFDLFDGDNEDQMVNTLYKNFGYQDSIFAQRLNKYQWFNKFNNLWPNRRQFLKYDLFELLNAMLQINPHDRVLIEDIPSFKFFENLINTNNHKIVTDYEILLKFRLNPKDKLIINPKRKQDLETMENIARRYKSVKISNLALAIAFYDNYCFHKNLDKSDKNLYLLTFQITAAKIMGYNSGFSLNKEESFKYPTIERQILKTLNFNLQISTIADFNRYFINFGNYRRLSNYKDFKFYLNTSTLKVLKSNLILDYSTDLLSLMIFKITCRKFRLSFIFNSHLKSRRLSRKIYNDISKII